MARRLHRFPLSHYSEKGRALLDFKELDYSVVEHRLGLPQLGIYRLSGQRKLPVLEDGEKVVPDSTAIGLYLEGQYPEKRALLPTDPERRREVLALEDRIDRVLGGAAPVVWFVHALERDPRAPSLLALEVHGMTPALGGLFVRGLRRAHQLERVQKTAARAASATRRLLAELCERLERSPYLTSETPTLADVAAAGLAFHLKFPRSRHLALPELAGEGVPGFADDRDLSRFFDWRDEFYAEYLA